MATIQKTGNYMVLFNDENKRVAYEQIPMSGKTLQIEVKLYNIAKAMGLRVR